MNLKPVLLLCLLPLGKGYAQSAPLSYEKENQSIEDKALFETGFGGYFDSYFSDGRLDTNSKKVHQGSFLSKMALYGYGSKELSSSWTLGGRVKGEGYASSLQNPHSSGKLKEAYVMLSSDAYGRFMAGAMDNVSEMMTYDAPDVGAMGVNNSLFYHLLLKDKKTQEYFLTSTALTSGNNNLKASYISPSLGNIKVGFSYLSEGNSHQKELQIWEIRTGFKSALLTSVNALFEGDSLSTGLTASYGYYFGHLDTEDQKQYSVSSEVRYLDFVLAGGYRKTDYSTPLPSNQNGQSFNIGFGYENTLFGISTSYMKSSQEKTSLYTKTRASMAEVSFVYHVSSDMDIFLSGAKLIYGDRPYKSAFLTTAGLSLLF
ncbi:MAG: porin [Alphaproteobacteria bacterium]|nr:porin [Alphaproteobacteria bacterium]